MPAAVFQGLVSFDTLEFVPGKGGYYVHDIRIFCVVLGRDVISTDCSNMFLSSPPSTKSDRIITFANFKNVYLYYMNMLYRKLHYILYTDLYIIHTCYMTSLITDFPRVDLYQHSFPS